jgi:branched-chain amino acid transport system permease protein
MAAFRVERATRASRVFAAVLGVVVLATLPCWGGSRTMRLVSEMASYLALAQLWNLLAGYAGLVSVGPRACVGVGGYTRFYLSSQLDRHPLLALGCAAPVCVLLSLPMALAVFRLRGAYFAVCTWGLAEPLPLGVRLMTPLGAGLGMSLPPAIVRQRAPDRAGR